MNQDKLPLIKLNGSVLFPETLGIYEVERSAAVIALENPDKQGSLVFVATQTQHTVASGENVYHIGTVARIENVVRLSATQAKLQLVGLQRGVITDFEHRPPVLVVGYNALPDDEVALNQADFDASLQLARTSFESYIRHMGKISPDLGFVKNSQDLGAISYKMMGGIVSTDVLSKQRVLEESNPVSRLRLAVIMIQKELEKLLVQKEVMTNVRSNVEKHQKEYYLREHMKVIKEQLGEQENDPEPDEYAARIHDLSAGEEVKDKLNKELAKLKRISPTSQESSVVREYLDLVLDLPWGTKTTENTDLANSELVLEEDHYGLTKVKERIVEFLAVRHKTQGLNAPILCLVGPPGVGKTSIAKSIAKALNREYVRISLGGLHDESEIRGHRKTYLGSMPGRVIGALRQAKKDNPMILFDELDKISTSHRGDPASALLEVLDKEQNKTFRDNYLEVPYDISDAMFVCTANTLEGIPAALRDRLDIIQLSSYTFQEKKEIAKKYLLPKQMKDHALTDGQLTLTEPALEAIINYYTKEAGVRQLERQIETLCRKTVRKSVGFGEEFALTVDQTCLDEYLGKPKYRLRKTTDHAEVGIVNGLAYTAFGGDTLSIEVNKARGKGGLKLTGNVGKVMDESATAAYSYIRSNCEALGVDHDFYRKLDLHIHIPEGAIPKDGPSAGITMTTAMVSVLTDAPVRNDVGMTGEITIRGKVLPIGGLKEKVLAAKAAGIKTVILPADNESDLSEIEDYAKEGLDFVLATDISQVLTHALVS